MKTAIMTDTNSGLTVSEGKDLGIFVLPMPVLVDGRCYFEGVDITSAQLYEAMRQERRITTSQPAPGDMTSLWNAILDEGFDEIIHIPMTSGLSGSFQSATLLAGDFGGRVCVADNRRISVTQRAAALDAKKLADKGCSAVEIKAFLESTARQASIYLTVDSLKYLQRSGRLSSSAAVLGTVLNIKPVLSIRDQQIDAFAKMRGMRLCERRMIDALHDDLAGYLAFAKKLRVETAGTLESQADIEHWVNLVQRDFPQYKVEYAPLPCSIACHIGPNCKGIGAVAVL